MEKQRSKSNFKFSRRLLISLLSLLFSTQMFAQVLSAAEINALRIKPVENQNLYTKTDLKFELLIPKVKASQIQLVSSTQRSDVTFRTFRKIDDYERGGTLIEIWFNFEKKGTYTLTPLQVSIQGRRRNLRFDEITVTDDPAKQTPRIVIKFDNGATLYSDNGMYTAPVFSAAAGKKLAFTVYLQYAAQLMNFTWDIPKDAIFTQTKSYEIMEVKYRERNTSHELIPVASFEWTSLAKGEKTLPKMKIIATAYNGSRYELIMPELAVTFEEGKISKTSNKEDKLFDSAFTENIIEAQEKNSFEITLEVCETLATLYSRERNSIFPNYHLKKQRQNYELEKNLPVNYEREYSLHMIIGALLLLLGGILLLLLSIHEKKPLRIMFSIGIIVFALIVGIYGIIKRAEIQGICTGCTIYSIPEETAEAKAEMGAGNKVRITEKTEKWLYIELGETGGWCRAENVIIIK